MQLSVKHEAAQSAYRIGGRKALEEMGFKAPDKVIGARWSDVAIVTAWVNGWDVVDSNGVEDYQGWGGLLLTDGSQWATLKWSYGSCGGCDSYEDMAEYDVIANMGDLIDVHASEDVARMKLAEGNW